LGSGPALASATRDNTFFLWENEGNSLLIDCAGSPFHKLLRVGAQPDRLGGVLLTHAHPDHIYGLPSLIHEMWLWGRREALHIYANEHSHLSALSLVDVFQLRSKPVPLEFHLISEEPDSLLLQCADFDVHTSPVRHEIPTHAVRITSRVDGKAVAFSADTSPCPELVTLAREADLMFHECAVQEPHPFHSTPEDVGRVASEAEVARVVLVHCHHHLAQQPRLALARIAKLFPGEVSFAKDFDVYDL
jgi:ribonuclease Z